MRIIRLPEVIQVTGLSRSSIYLYMHKGTFPRPVRLGVRSVGWQEQEVFEWINSRSKAAE